MIAHNTDVFDLVSTGSVPLKHVDQRSDEEIVEALSQFRPVISEKNVWAFWDGGLMKMRAWARRNVVGWVRMLGPEWTVRVLDRVEGSGSHFLNYLDATQLPTCLVEGKMAGKFSGQHASDMVRLPCILQHGGVWMDVGIMLFMHLEPLCWDLIKAPSSKFEVALASADPSLMSGLAENFFIAARKGNSFIRRWMDVFFEVWKDRSDCQGIHAHPLFRHLITGNVAPFLQKASGDKMDYFGAYLAYERLRLMEDPTDGFNGPNYCRNRVLLLEYQEFASAAMLTHDDGRRQFQYLSTRYQGTQKDEAYDEALNFCKHMLSKTAMMKLYHWKQGGAATLADLWDQPANVDADHEAGTFAEVMRYVSTHYTQKRRLKPVRVPPPSEKILVAGLLEVPED